MDFPFGHHHRREEEEDEYPKRPPYDRRPEFQPPPPEYRDEEHHHHHHHHRPHHEAPPPYDRFDEGPPPPPRPETDYGYSQPPGYPSVQHVSHEYHGFRPNPSDDFRQESFPNQRPSEEYGGYGGGGSGNSYISNKRTVRVYSKAETDYSLTIRDGEVILARSNENDEYQHWIKDERYSTKVKDEEGFPCFALVNKATGEAIKHSIGATHPVRLVPYNPDYLDESVLWTESNDLGDGYRCIRMVNNIRLNIDAFHGDKNHGGVRDGTTIVLWEWLKGENQRWKIVPRH